MCKRRVVRRFPQLAEQIDQRAINAGGALFGLWAGQIGLWRDEGIMMTAWDNLQSARAHGPEMADASIHGLDRAIYLEATVRPTANEQPQCQLQFGKLAFVCRTPVALDSAHFFPWNLFFLP